MREKLFSERLIEPQITENKRQIQFVESFKLKRGTQSSTYQNLYYSKKKKKKHEISPYK